MFDTISCEADNLTEMYRNRYIYHTIMNSDVCREYGLDFLTIKKKFRRKMLIDDQRKNFILSIFPPVKIAALCNTLAIVHKKIVLNKAKRVYISDDLIIDLQTATPDVKTESSNNSVTKLEQSNNTSDSTASVDDKSTMYLSSYIEPLISQIIPTKTLSHSDEVLVSSSIKAEQSATLLNENSTQASISHSELNSTNEIPVTSSTECKNLNVVFFFFYFITNYF